MPLPKRKKRYARTKRGRHARRQARGKARLKSRATATKNRKQITKLWKTFAPKFNYFTVNNALVSDYSTPATGYQSLCLNALDASVPIATDARQYLYREEDSVQSRLRNIRIHMTMHAVSGPEGGKLTKACVLLVRTTNNIGGVGGITMPALEEVFDPDSYAGELAPFECFRTTQGVGSEVLQNTNILKKWVVWLEPQGGDCEVAGTTTNNASNPAAEAGTYNSINSPAGQNVNYTSTRPSSRSFTWTHKCNNAIVKFAGANSSNPINAKYFLVLIAGDSIGHGVGWRCNATIKTNFYDS